jgi:hypothetical protein
LVGAKTLHIVAEPLTGPGLLFFGDVVVQRGVIEMNLGMAREEIDTVDGRGKRSLVGDTGTGEVDYSIIVFSRYFPPGKHLSNVGIALEYLG